MKETLESLEIIPLITEDVNTRIEKILNKKQEGPGAAQASASSEEGGGEGRKRKGRRGGRRREDDTGPGVSTPSGRSSRRRRRRKRRGPAVAGLNRRHRLTLSSFHPLRINEILQHQP